MITLVHGGQTGVDRGAHYAAIDNGWRVTGYMPRGCRDEYGPIPPDVAQHLIEHDKSAYAARTAANVRSSDALLVVVRDRDDPRATPGTALTLDLAAELPKRQMVVDPTDDAGKIARWIWQLSCVLRELSLPLEGVPDPVPVRLMVAGPRESKWPEARVETAGLLRRVGLELRGIAAGRMASITGSHV